MLRVDSSLFSNVITSVQRTGNLTGGAIRGLPNGAVIEGLKGINSFGSDVAEAQKEFEMGRLRPCLERIKQLQTRFAGIEGRWNSTVGGVISSARQGRQQLPQQKLNEIKSAQTKMRQLIGPANKSFQDLVAALELAVTLEGRQEDEDDTKDVSQTDDQPSSDQAAESVDVDSKPVESEPASETPDVNLLGRFMESYQFGDKLELKRGADKKVRINPQLEVGKFYFVSGMTPPRVVRIRELRKGSILVLDTIDSSELLIEAHELKALIVSGIWTLKGKPVA